MDSTESTKYASIWDKSTWFIIALVAVCCIIPTFLDDGVWPTVIGLVMLVFVLVTFSSVYYKIEGDKLIVYTFFIPASYPVDKIKAITKTDNVLSAPATSLTHRLAITFTDRKVLKSTAPLIISPVRQDAFIGQLLAINPSIITDIS